MAEPNHEDVTQKQDFFSIFENFFQAAKVVIFIVDYSTKILAKLQFCKKTVSEQERH